MGMKVDSVHLETWFIFIVLPRKGQKKGTEVETFSQSK